MVPCFMFGALALVVGFVAAEAAALRQWRGGWQMAALVPAGIVFVVIVRILADAMHHPTSRGQP